MTTIAYIANEFPSPVEPYVMDEINELRRRGVHVICCSGKRVAPDALSLAERAFWKETHFFQPLSDEELLRAAGALASDRHSLWHLLRPLLLDPGVSTRLRIRALGHTLMGSALAQELAPLNVQHIHCHHGYFASWVALVVARLLGIGFSFTLHGSDLLYRGDLLTTKLRDCRFCVTVSNFNRDYIFRHYRSIPAEKVIVQRLGVDRPISQPPLARSIAAIGNCIADFSPDLGHIRGVYHHLSPSILWELKRRAIPTLYHLNDFKMLCPTYNCVSRDQACDKCHRGAFYHAVTEGCYRGSRSSAVVLAAEAYFHKWLRTYQTCIDLFLAPSEFVREKLIESGLPAGRIEVLPHFQTLPNDDELAADEGYLLYFGRLSSEKGLDELLHALVREPHIPVVIAGDGPERPRLESLARSLNLNRVLFTGTVHGRELKNLIAGCRFSLFPSHAYETLGKSILESYAYGRPVIASDLGSRRELVEHGVTGLLYSPGNRDQFAKAIAFLSGHPGLIEKMGAAGRARVQSKHDPQQHLEKLSDIYSRLVSPRKVLSFSASPVQSETRPKVRVAFIGGRGVVSKYSGIESYYEQVGPELARRGHEVTVYCRTYFTPPMTNYHGMRVLRFPTIRSKHLETFVHTLLSTAHAMASDCDIVHYHCLGPALFSFLPRLAGKKTVVTVQGLDWQRGKWGRIAAGVLRLGEAAAVALPNATMVVSHTLQQHYRDHHARATIYIPNGATTTAPSRRHMHLQEGSLLPDNYVLFLGRFSPEKNCHLLINAFEKIHTEMKLVLAGGSSHSDSYVNELRCHESDRIRFLPWVSGTNLEELLSNAALFVLPSELEGLSLALLDAMAAGVCVLTSDIPENREVVDGAGFTFRRGDCADLQRMLDVLVHNPELRRQAVTREKARIQSQYLWPEIARSIDSTYYDILGLPNSRREYELNLRCS